MRSTIFYVSLALFTFIVCGCHRKQVSRPATSSNESLYPLLPVQYINPMIGTGGHGHTYPGATVPFGMVQLSPDTRLTGWDGCSGYHYSDSLIYGFSHTHLQGTGVSDYGDILFMPTNNILTDRGAWNETYASHFDHKSEKASAGYYSVFLKDYRLQVECTATERVGIQRYKFSSGDTCRMFLDFMHRDELIQYDIQTEGDTAIYGYRISKAWAEEQHCYFYAVFNKPFKELDQLYNLTEELDPNTGKKQQVIEMLQLYTFKFDPADEITLKVGVSGVDVDGAKNNLYTEAPHWDFTKFKREAENKWANQMEKWPAPPSASNTEKFNYYTALYHCCTTPNVWSDIDGRFRGMDQQVHVAKDYTRYTVFSLWDTFRALHPLLVTIEPERTRDFIHTFIDMYKESGHLPIWELAGNETNCMIGYHAASVILDAYAKGIRDFDTNAALEAMIATSKQYGDDKSDYAQLGYLPSDKFSESVSKTLEYAYNDWCIATFAQYIGNDAVYKEYIQRAQNWKNVFDPKSKFMRARRNGGFIEPFDPFEVNFNYTEANAWQYQFFVPHDIQTLIEYHGGKDAFEKHLDNLFTANSNTTGREQADITGLIGQYAHGNEPSHHLAYLYNYTNHPEKSGRYLDQILKTQYTNAPDGLCGNEDCGQMSAWYVLAMQDMYALLPGQPKYTSAFSANGTSTRQIQGKQWDVQRIVPSVIAQDVIPGIPVIQGPQTAFKDSSVVTVYGFAPMKKLHITVEEDKGSSMRAEGSESKITETSMNQSWVITSDGSNHAKTFTIKNNCKVSAWFEDASGQPCQNASVAMFRKRNDELKITDISAYDNQYNGGGREALIDGMNGAKDFRTGGWQGWFGKNMEVTIDLGKAQAITTVKANFLEEIKSWIWLPSEVEIYLSTDGVNFSLAGVVKNESPVDREEITIQSFERNLRGYGRYVKVVAKPAFEKIPEWHLGAGGKCWIFADEITIR